MFTVGQGLPKLEEKSVAGLGGRIGYPGRGYRAKGQVENLKERGLAPCGIQQWLAIGVQIKTR